MFVITNSQEKGCRRESPELSGAISLLYVITTIRKSQEGVSRDIGSNPFLITYEEKVKES